METTGQVKSTNANQRPKKTPTRYAIFHGEPPKMTGLNIHMALGSFSFVFPSAIASREFA
jgi:hypothetical protein